MFMKINKRIARKFFFIKGWDYLLLLNQRPNPGPTPPKPPKPSPKNGYGIGSMIGGFRILNNKKKVIGFSY